MTEFVIPHVLRCLFNAESQSFPNKGFDIVYCGRVIIGDSSVNVFEKDSSSGETTRPVQTIPYSSISEKIKLTNIRSLGGKYFAKQVTITGVFGENFHGGVCMERVIMQMPYEVYNEFIESLRERYHRNI